jgi:hypothetical protein
MAYLPKYPLQYQQQKQTLHESLDVCGSDTPVHLAEANVPVSLQCH